MERSFEEQWSLFSSHYKNFFCPFCKHQSFDFSNPMQDRIAGADVIAVSCWKCGHIELFDAIKVAEEADRIYKERHKPPLW